MTMKNREYPVALISHKAFTLLELLVVISIIAMLVGILLPVLSSARAAARDRQCSAQLKQLATATISYLADYKETFYWRGASIDNEGMDWYVWGGKESVLYTGQNGVYPEGLFNHFKPRPLNPYVGGIDVFHCPGDAERWFWPSATGNSLFEWVGNSYQFNADGLAGIRLVQVKYPDRTVLYGDAAMLQFYDGWHRGRKGSVAFVDGRVDFIGYPHEGSEYTWEP